MCVCAGPKLKHASELLTSPFAEAEAAAGGRSPRTTRNRDHPIQNEPQKSLSARVCMQQIEPCRRHLLIPAAAVHTTHVPAGRCHCTVRSCTNKKGVTDTVRLRMRVLNSDLSTSACAVRTVAAASSTNKLRLDVLCCTQYS